MSGFDYSKTAATARRLIDRFGQVVTFSRTSALGAQTVFSAVAVVAATIKHALADSGIQIGDDKLLVDVSTVPEPGDRISYNGLSRVIVDPVITLNPGGTAILVECYARNG